LYQWKISDGTRQEIVPKGLMLNSIAKPFDGTTNNSKVYVVIQDKRSLVEYDYGGENSEKKVESDVIFGEIVLTRSNKMVICGVNQ